MIYIPMPIITNNSTSSGKPLPEWANITLYVAFSAVLVAIIIFMIYEAIDAIKEEELGFAILFIIVAFLPISLLILLSCMMWC